MNVTRRQALELTAAGGATVWLAAHPLPAAADVPVSPLLRRSAWTGLVGATVSAGGTGLRLDAVDDLQYAAQRGLTGSEDAFVLRLSGDTALDQATYSVRRSDGQAIDLFMAAVGIDHTYEIVVDRSVDIAPPPPVVTGAAAAPVAVAVSAATPERYRAVATVAVRRGRPGLRARLRLRRPRQVARIRVSVLRDDVVLARGQAAGGRRSVAVGLHRRTAVPRGRYELRVDTVDHAGVITTVRQPVFIR